MVGVHGEGRRHNRKSLRDSRAREEMPGCVRGCITQRARKDCGRLMSGMQPMAGHVPVQVEAGEGPAMGLGKLFGQVEQSLEEELTVPPACGHAVREVSAPVSTSPTIFSIFTRTKHSFREKLCFVADEAQFSCWKKAR